MSIAELQVYAVETADATGGVCVVRCVGGVARAGQVYAAGELRVGLRRIERYGRVAESVDAGHTARVHLTGAVVALLARGQVLTYVPPGGHALVEVEAWLATGPELLDEPHPGPLRALATARMQDEALPDGMRLRWGRIALAALDRAGRPEEQPYVRSYLIQSFGPGDTADPDRDPAGLCRDVLAGFELTPAQAAEQSRAWRELPRPAIQRLRRIKNLIPCMAPARPYLAASDPLAVAADAWAALRPRLP
ncbi:hypothetical protein OTB20_00050 [Streptomyces sp. H27-H1]|uniref:hypothetical protein n=1 Tax=Streptomyces sp. H27-H1 TaxID=2996461 RepID=UPI0022720905|nr:hypothetical protein [Streptomyces sp. H27-H1]MCY0924635.1 hypothetical protein [Streptomyces sp. H27-H1]